MLPGRSPFVGGEDREKEEGEREISFVASPSARVERALMSEGEKGDGFFPDWNSSVTTVAELCLAFETRENNDASRHTRVQSYEAKYEGVR